MIKILKQKLKTKLFSNVFSLFFSLFFSMFFATISVAEAVSLPLPANEAFAFSASMNSAQQLLLTFRIAPGYYLYAKRLHITFEPAINSDVRIPQGDFKYDATRGRFEALSGIQDILVTVKTKLPATRMTIAYQGCSQEGFCYPPTQKSFAVNLLKPAITEINLPELRNENTLQTLSVLPTNQNKVMSILQSSHLFLTMLIFIGLGILLSFTPCVLPMVPILTSIIVGQKKPMSVSKAFFLSLTYVLGSASMYACAGLFAAMMGNSLQVWLQKPVIVIASSSLFILLALSLFDVISFRAPQRFQQFINRLSGQQQRGTYVGVLLMGMLSTLIVSPCVTAPLVGVLMYIAATGDRLLGAGALFALGIGMGLPLMAVGVSVGKWLPKNGAWMEAVKKIFGFLMLGMAMWMLSRIFPHAIMQMIIALFLFSMAIFFGVYLSQVIGFQGINRSLGLLFAVASLIVLVNGIMQKNNYSANIEQQKNFPAFAVIHNTTDLHKKLLAAQLIHEPVIVDFYADWCESCLAMEKNVFAKNKVIEQLNHVVLLRADLSANDADDEALLKKYHVIAPPTVLFFNAQGEEISSERIIGEVNADEFLARFHSSMVANCDNKRNC